jgi:hypothetical protein
MKLTRPRRMAHYARRTDTARSLAFLALASPVLIAILFTLSGAAHSLPLSVAIVATLAPGLILLAVARLVGGAK